MGVDTKAVILTEEKEFWSVSQKIGNAIYQIIQPRLKDMTMQEVHSVECNWKLPSLHVSDSFHSLEYEPTEYFRISFRYKGEDRILHIHTDCDCDLRDEFGDEATGIIMSLGCWGSSVEIMKEILTNVQIEGEKWILEQDCNDVWEQI